MNFDLLQEGERLDDLQTGGLRIIQRKDAFRFGTDSVLLADFASPRPRDFVADLGAGTGAISLLMAVHEPRVARIDAVEVQGDIADMAARSVLMDNLQDKILVHAIDMRDAHLTLGYGKYSLVVCNPPYGKDGGALVSKRESQRLARHEGDLTPADIAMSAGRLLKNGGRFAVIYPSPRALEMLEAMEKNGLMPKRIRTVHAYQDRAPKLVLVDAMKGARPGLHWQPPLILNDPDGQPSAEWRRIYRIDALEKSK